MYQIGDFVIYRFLNVCKIDSIETPSFENNPDKKYYRLTPVFNNKSDTIIYVPVDSVEGLRSLTTREEVEKLLAEIPQIKPLVSGFKKPAQLMMHYQNILSSCNLRHYLGILKEVATKEKSGVKRLSEVELKYRNKTETILCQEFALVLGKTPEEIKTRIDKALT